MSTHWVPAWEEIPDFDMQSSYTDQWDEWYLHSFRKLELFTDFKELHDAMKVSLLLLKLANFSAKVLEVDENTVEYAELLSKLRKHCSPVNLRQLFFTRRQRPGESFAEFAKCLEDLSRPCRFKEAKDSLVRDIFLLNMHEEYAEINEILRSQTEPMTLQKTIMLANALLFDLSKPPGLRMDSLEGMISAYNEAHGRGSLIRIKKEPPACCFDKKHLPDSTNDIDTDGLPVSSQDTQGIRKPTVNQGDTIQGTQDIKKPATQQTVTRDFSCFYVKAEEIPQAVPPVNGKRSGVSIGSKPRNTGGKNLVGCEQTERVEGTKRSARPAVNGAADRQAASNYHRNRHVTASGNTSNDHEHKSAQPPIREGLVNKRIDASKPKSPAFSVADTIEPSFDQKDKKVAPVKTNVPTPSVRHDKQHDITPQLPIPFNRYAQVQVMHRTPEGKLYVCPTSALNEIKDHISSVAQWFSDPKNQQVLKNCGIGAACASLFNGSWYRAKIVSKDSPDNGVFIRYSDFGNEEFVSDLTRLMALPQEFADVPAFIFSVKIPLSVTCEEGDLLWIMPLHEEADGSWCVSVNRASDEVVRAKGAPNGQSSPSIQASSTMPTSHPKLRQPEEKLRATELKASLPAKNTFSGRVAHGGQPEPTNDTATVRPPPLPENTFTVVRVVYNGPEGVFAIEVEKIDAVTQMLDKIRKVDLCPLVSSPVIGNCYLAPYDGMYYRVKLQSISQKDCHVIFIDFGNEMDLPIQQLRQLPPEFVGDMTLTFKVSDTYNAPEGTDLKVKPVFEEGSGSWMYLVEDELAAGDCSNLSTSGNAPKPAPSRLSPPIPPNSSTIVRVVYVGTEGTFAVPVDKLESLQEITQKITQMEHLLLQTRPIVGDVYIAPFEGNYFRARVLSTDQKTCHIVFVDFGNEIDLPADQLRKLPSECASNFITFKVSDIFIAAEGTDLKVKPVFEEGSGSWTYLVEDELAAGDSSNLRSSVNAPKPAPSRPSPPIPPNSFTNVRVVYVGTEGTFAVPVDKLESLQDITQKISKMEHLLLQTRPIVGDVYVAPFEGYYCRARVLSTDQKTCHIVFVDFGNEIDLPVDQLRDISPEYASNFLTFKVSDISIAAEGTDLKVKPVFEEGSGSWTYLVEDELAAGDSSNLSTSGNAPPAPSRPSPPIPPNSFTNVRVVYVGTEGTFAVPVDKLESLQDITQKISKMEHLLLQTRPIVGDVYIAPFEGYYCRAQVLSTDQKTCRIVFVDFGNEIDLPVDQLRDISPEYASNFLTFKVSDISIAPEGTDLKVKPVFEEGSGSWTYLVEDELAAGDSSNLSTSGNAPPAPSRPSPPIPPNSFTNVRVVYVGTEGTFAVPVDKLESLQDITQKISKMEHLLLQTRPIVGDVYIAPFEGYYCRARVLSTDQKTCHIVFVDFGNEIDLPVDQLRDITPEYASNFLTFKVSDISIAPEGTDLKVKPVFEEGSGSWTYLVEDELAAGDSSNLSTSGNAPPAPSRPSPPIPPNSFTNVRVVYVGTEGTFAVPVDKLESLQDITQKISKMEHLLLQTRPIVGDVYVAPFEGYYCRARVLSTDQQTCHIVFVDFGNEIDLPADQLRDISPDYASNFLTFKVSNIFIAPEGTDLKVKPVFEEGSGSWTYLVEDELAAGDGSNLNTSSNAPKPEPSRPSPPIPPNSFTNVRVVYVGTEGTFAVPVDKLESLQDITQKISQMEHLLLQTRPIVGDVYIAPFEGYYCRARVLSTDQKTCHIVFVDFGNEIDLPVDQLRDISPEYASNFLTFKVSDIFIAAEGTDLKVKPVFEEGSGSWTYLFEDDAAGDRSNLKSSGNAAPLPPTPPLAFALPRNSFTNVRVMYAGTEGTFAVPVEMLDSLQAIIQKIAQMEHLPLQSRPIVGDVYIAPFEGYFYRARVTSTDQQTCHVGFVDFGNEIDLPIDQLRKIPSEFASNFFTFKMAVEPSFELHVGFEALVKPISMGPDGTLIVNIAENSGNPQ